MGEFLVIRTELLAAVDMLEVLGDPRLLYWEWGISSIEAATKWLPNKGFKILSKFFDRDYKPGTVGDEADKLITGVGGCYLTTPRGRTNQIPIWCSTILELPQMREELRRILDGNVLDMSFEEEVKKDMEKSNGKSQYKPDKQALDGDNENLKNFAEILTKLANCIDQVKTRREKEGTMPYIFFEFYIPRET